MLSLVRQLTRREIQARYRGSLLGVLWSVITPLAMLAVFTFVFAVVFQSRWGVAQADASTTEFALAIFAGLTTFGMFSDVVGRAPALIVGQPNLVKKVVFPLEVLPVVALLSALVQAAISFAILLVFQGLFGTGLHATALLLPLLVVPLCLTTLGIGWLLAALGVYVRDIGQIIPPLVMALMFLSPIFYPASAVPEWFRPFSAYNPLGYSVETVRNAVIFGTAPDPALFLLALAGGLVVAALGYAFFRKTRKGFADVL